MKHTTADLLRNPRFLLAKFFLPATIVEKYFLARREIVVYEFDAKNFSTLEEDTQLTVRQAALDDMEKLVEMRTHERNFGEDFVRKKRYLVKVSERLDGGHRCFIAERCTEILGYLWIAFDELYDNGIDQRIVLREGEAMIYDLYVASAQRGRGIGPEILSQSIRHLGSRGCRRVYAMVESYNTPSRRAFEKINGKTNATIIFLKIFALTRLMQTPGSSYLDLKDSTVEFSRGTGVSEAGSDTQIAE